MLYANILPCDERETLNNLKLAYADIWQKSEQWDAAIDSVLSLRQIITAYEEEMEGGGLQILSRLLAHNDIDVESVRAQPRKAHNARKVSQQIVPTPTL